jgi:uncharacterized protein (DUF362 family)
MKTMTVENKRLSWGRVESKEEFQDFIRGLELRPPFIVKPNWICEDYGHFTDPLILEWVLEALHPDGELVVTEAYSARNMLVCGAPNTARFNEPQLERVRESEQGFMGRTGIGDTLERLDVEYVNVAEEVLAGRAVEPSTTRQRVVEVYGEVARKEFYTFIPTKLYALREGTFIDMAKFKVFFSMCTKNLFGMIPEYVGYGSRYVYHGEKDMHLSENIVDINRVYRALFNVVGIVEGVRILSCEPGKGTATHSSKFGYDYDVMEDCELIYYGDNPLWLDAFIHQQCGRDPVKTDHLEHALHVFEPWPERVLSRAIEEGNPLLRCS